MIERGYLVVHKSKHTRQLMSVLAVFKTREAAQTYADNANRWYGHDHPLYPLVVDHNDVMIAPPLFPEL